MGEWPPLQREVRDLFIESRHGRPLWGFKDPRLLLGLEGWRQALPSLEPVGVFRHPGAVALWSHYNQRLLELHQQHPFPLIEFEADATRVRQSLVVFYAAIRIARGSQPTRGRPRPQRLEPQWRHHSDARLALAAPELGLYEELRRRALSPT